MSEKEVATTTETELDLGALSNKELAEFEGILVEEYGTKRANESFSEQDVTELESLLQTINTVRDEMTFRVDLAASDEAVGETKGAAFLAKVTKAAKAEAPAVVEDEEVVEDEADIVAAPQGKVSVAPEAKASGVVISPKGIEGDKPAVKEERKPSGIVASADVQGFRAGQELADFGDVARAFMAKRKDVRGTDKGYDGSRFLVASLQGDYNTERTLSMDLDTNMRKIEAITSPSALAASGGYCAPTTPYYQLQVFGDAHRPVRDSMPVFRAERGGIRFMPSPRLGDLSGSVRRTTAGEDEAGYTNQTPAGTTAPKPSLHVVCEGEQTATIQAISRSLTFGNMGARTYPEQVEAWIKLGLVEFARYAEVELLDAISNASTKLTAAQTYGATFALLEQVSLVTASFRSRYRLASSKVLRALFPFWVMDVIKTDIAAQSGGDQIARFNVTDGDVNAWFRARNIEPSFYQDYTTAEGVPFNPVVPGALETWPTDVEWFIYPEGAFLYLDGGTLDLGLVRDSTLNSQNDYQIFYEEFGGLAMVGQESIQVTSTLCSTGTTAPLASVRTCEAGGS